MEHFCTAPNSIVYDHRLKASSLRVYLYLSGWYRRGDGGIRKSVRDMAAALSLSTTTVVKGIAQLEELEHVRVVRKYRAPSRYFLLSSRFPSKYSRRDEYVIPEKEVDEVKLKALRDGQERKRLRALKLRTIHERA